MKLFYQKRFGFFFDFQGKLAHESSFQVVKWNPQSVHFLFFFLNLIKLSLNLIRFSWLVSGKLTERCNWILDWTAEFSFWVNWFLPSHLEKDEPPSFFPPVVIILFSNLTFSLRPKNPITLKSNLQADYWTRNFLILYWKMFDYFFFLFSLLFSDVKDPSKCHRFPVGKKK